MLGWIVIICFIVGVLSLLFDVFIPNKVIEFIGGSAFILFLVLGIIFLVRTFAPETDIDSLIF